MSRSSGGYTTSVELTRCGNTPDTRISYDREGHKLFVSVQGEVEVYALQDIKLTCDANVRVSTSAMPRPITILA